MRYATYDRVLLRYMYANTVRCLRRRVLRKRPRPRGLFLQKMRPHYYHSIYLQLVCQYVIILVCTCVHAYVYTYIYIYTYTYSMIYALTMICIHISLSIYIYIYMYIHVYVCIYIYIHIYISMRSTLSPVAGRPSCDYPVF